MSVLNYYIKLGINQYTVNATCPWHFLKCWKCHVFWTFPLSNNWHGVRFPYHSENLTFTWDFCGQRHMACRCISYNIQKVDIYMWFLWTTAHGMPLHFLCCSEIWDLNEISLDNDTRHAVTFPILFRNLTFTFDSFGQWHMACRYISYTVQNLTFTWDSFGQWCMVCHYISYTLQKFDIYMRFLWSTTHGMLLHFLYYSEISHVHEISLVNDTLYAITLPVLFRNLTSTVHEISLVKMQSHFL